MDAPLSLPPLEPPPWLVAEARVLELPPPHELRSLVRDEAAELLDRLLVRVTRGRGAIDLAIGECLASLQPGGRLFRLGYVGIGDLAREKLGLAPRTAQLLARRARALRARPLLRAAVLAGEVSPRKADAILDVAVGDAEAAWVSRARAATVRALEIQARAPAEDESWERIDATVPPEHREIVDLAFDLAGKLLGATAPRWRRLEAMCQEFLAGHPVEPRPDDERPREPRAGDLLEPTMAALMEGAEREMDEWRWLDELHARSPFGHGPIEPVAAPVPGSADGDFVDPIQVDEDLRRLARMRLRWDSLFGQLALLVQYCGLWREMRFASFGHYCQERLGMSGGAVTQRTALERRLHRFPALREALESGRLSYEKVRAVASAADEASLPGWIAQAERLTCIQLQRAVAAADDDQMCARGEVVVRVPESVATVVRTAFRAAREAAGRWLSPGECLVWISASFIGTWSATLERRPTRSRRIIERDGGFCQVPGCSRPASDAHHIQFKSAGGGDEEHNQTGGCKCHHLNCIHEGYVRVSGRAPDGLRWELGLGWDGEPLEVFEPEGHH